MERSAWTDKRLEDRFDHVDGELSSLRTEMHDEFKAVRTEMREGFAEVRGEINDLRLIMIRFQGAMLIALLGVIAAILARGA
jgi:hypothetical protein